VCGVPVPLECFFLGKQAVFLVTQQSGLFVILGISGGSLVAADLVQPAIQRASIGSGTRPLLESRQPGLLAGHGQGR
jgi:hypothetical protein